MNRRAALAAGELVTKEVKAALRILVTEEAEEAVDRLRGAVLPECEQDRGEDHRQRI